MCINHSLCRQYRMHPSISWFASEEFYENELLVFYLSLVFSYEDRFFRVK